MTSVNSNKPDFSGINLETTVISNLIKRMEDDKKNEDPKALLASLKISLEEVLSVVESGGKSDKIVRPNFNAAATDVEDTSNNSQVPTDASMQEAMGKLMGLLSDLEGKIAQWGTNKALMNSEVGNSLMNEMQSQVTQAQTELQKVLDNQKTSDFWSTFTKVAEAVVGAIICVAAIMCGQPELAAIVFVMTTLAVSGLMDDATKGISKLLQKCGCTSEEANIIAATILVVASIAVTMATCGAGAPGTVEATTDAAASVAETSAETASATAMSTETVAESSSEITEESQSFTQRLMNSKYNIFKNLPKNVNLGIVAGSMAIGNTNFGGYLAAVLLEHMKENGTKEGLTIAIEVLVDLLAAIAGMGAGATVATGSAATQLKNASTLMDVLVKAQAAAGIAQAGGQFGTASAEFDLAEITGEVGVTQATLSLLRSMVMMNGSQSQADEKALSSQLRVKAEGLATTGSDLVKASAALAQVLKA